MKPSRVSIDDFQMDGVCGLSPTLIHFENHLGWAGVCNAGSDFLAKFPTRESRRRRDA